MTHGPTLQARGAALAIKTDVMDGLGAQTRDKGGPFPLREHLAIIESQTSDSDHRRPVQHRLHELRRRIGLSDRLAVVIEAIGRQRPAVILAGFDQVQLIAAHRAIFGFPQFAIGRKSQTVGRTEAAGPGFRRRQIRTGQRDLAQNFRGLGFNRVLRNVNRMNRRRAELARVRIARCRLAVQGQAQNLAGRDVRVLGVRHADMVAVGQEQVFAVGRESDLGAEIAALAVVFRIFAPQDLETFQARAVLAEHQLAAAQGQTGKVRIAGVGFRVGQIDIVIGLVMRRQKHAQHAAQASFETDGHILYLNFIAIRIHHPDRTNPFGDQHAAVGQEGDAPGEIERGHLGHGERQIGIGFDGADIHLGRRRSG